jgi:hypothetical protein
VVVSCEQDNEPLGSIKGEEYLGFFGDAQDE